MERKHSAGDDYGGATTSTTAAAAAIASASTDTSTHREPTIATASHSPLSFFPTPALDHAFAGIGAGAVATVCMNPLDLVKVQFQVSTAPSESLRAALSKMKARDLLVGGKAGKDMYAAMRTIVRKEGWTGLYRGISPNVVGNSASWGLYFLWYTMIKEYMAGREPKQSDGSLAKLSAGQHLLAASISGGVTAMMTNPIWVVKTRMFTTPRSAAAAAVSTRAAPEVYRGLWHGLVSITRHEGLGGLYKGAGLALVGVSNGALQFMAYEELKKWRSARARRIRDAEILRGTARDWGPDDVDENGIVKLGNTEYVVMSGAAKLVALAITYPYQVIRSRIQNHATTHLYPNIPTCIRLTYAQEGLRAFYKGMAANALRILPGTCVTFVVYENISFGLRAAARRRADAFAEVGEREEGSGGRLRPSGGRRTEASQGETSVT